MRALLSLFLSWLPLPGGATCLDNADCLGGHCMCIGGPDDKLSWPNPQDRPELRGWNGKPGIGVCQQGAIMPGAWFCEMRHGTTDFSGIIVD